jgi:hypothetical protein
MKTLVLFSAWWFLWYTVDGVTWRQHGLRFPSEARCEAYRELLTRGTGQEVLKASRCLPEHAP